MPAEENGWIGYQKVTEAHKSAYLCGSEMPHTMDTDRRETHKMQETGFTVDRDKCTGCGLCVKVCPGGGLSLDGTKTVRMAPFEEYGWNGCWQCEHCLAVCPAGAVSIFGHRPEDSLPPPAPRTAAAVLDALIANRHSCRRYQDRNVDAGVIQDVLIAGTYFELLCASRGLGAVMMTFPLGALEQMPEIKALLEIPEDHYIGMLIGFGYPEIRYAWGVQKTIGAGRVHRPGM